MTREERVARAVRLASIRTRGDAVEAYSERFGGFPSFLLMGASDDAVVGEVRHALRTGRPIEAPVPGARY